MKIGIIGAGGIARTVSQTLHQMNGMSLQAIASRSMERAKEMQAEFGFAKAYDSYEALCSDPEVELVYIATPHSHHYAHTMLALEHGKAVLCEKAFALNTQQTKAMLAKAKEKGVLLAEALWTRYMPSRAMIDKILNSGVIGKPRLLTANLCYPIWDKPRIYEPALAGGALLDLGVYGLNFAGMHFGANIERIESAVKLSARGVDEMETITLFYPDGRMAVLTHDIYARSDRKGIISGDLGYLVVENINNPQSITVFDTDDRQLAFYPVPQQISGYEYEFLETQASLADGLLENPSMPHAVTIQIMEQMDALRRDWGMVYPQETT